ncbi:MAG: hypothetical protein WBQ46_02240 [Terriglobales bacterium]
MKRESSRSEGSPMMAKPPKFKMGDKVFVVIAEERIAGTISVAPKTAGEKQYCVDFDEGEHAQWGFYQRVEESRIVLRDDEQARAAKAGSR